jgi:heme-degrading monooxygenase HmoA
MLALLFEVMPKAEGYQRYLEIAATLRPALEKHDGFLFIDRYRSLSRPDTILSHSLWRDEAALTAWRTFEPHHHAQVAGRNHVFVDYRLRIADVVLARTPGEPDWRPVRPSSYNEPTERPPHHLLIATSSGSPCSGAASDRFESLNKPGDFLSLYDVHDQEAAVSLLETLASAPSDRAGLTSLRLCEIERDYGMFDRREAPQYYPPKRRADGSCA